MTTEQLEWLAQRVAELLVARMHSPEWMDTEAAARYLGCSVQRLAIGRSTGELGIPFSRIGRLVRYSKARLDQHLLAAEVVNTTKP